MKNLFESNLFLITQDEDVVKIKDKKKKLVNLFDLEDKRLFHKIASCVELSASISFFDKNLELTLLEEDLQKIKEGQYVLKNSNQKDILTRVFTYNLMP